jgi:beta-glucosidase
MIPLLQSMDLLFTDIKNGKLDKYEDFRLPMQDRVQDLINKMTNEEKRVC